MHRAHVRDRVKLVISCMLRTRERGRAWGWQPLADFGTVNFKFLTEQKEGVRTKIKNTLTLTPMAHHNP